MGYRRETFSAGIWAQNGESFRMSMGNGHCRCLVFFQTDGKGWKSMPAQT